MGHSHTQSMKFLCEFSGLLGSPGKILDFSIKKHILKKNISRICFLIELILMFLGQNLGQPDADSLFSESESNSSEADLFSWLTSCIREFASTIIMKVIRIL